VTATARAYPAARPSALEVFIARAEARAQLYAAGELDLHEAQAAAVASGLVTKLGQDRVQQILRDVFNAVRGGQ
jgi:hypothetical protein